MSLELWWALVEKCDRVVFVVLLVLVGCLVATPWGRWWYSGGDQSLGDLWLLGSSAGAAVT